jgi:hypothetical protein
VSSNDLFGTMPPRSSAVLEFLDGWCFDQNSHPVTPLFKR